MVVQKRASSDALENAPKRANLDILFGNEDVDLRQLPPKVNELCPPPNAKAEESENITVPSPRISPTIESKNMPTKLDLVQAKLAEATKGIKQNGDEKHTISPEDMDLRAETLKDFNPADHKNTMNMSQSKQLANEGQHQNNNVYQTLWYKLIEVQEQLELEEAKQKESFEMSKLKLKAQIEEENNKVATPKSTPKEQYRFEDIDERVVSSIGLDTSPDSMNMIQYSDMRMNTVITHDSIEAPKFKGLLPRPPMMTVHMPPYGPAPMWQCKPRPWHDKDPRRRMRGGRINETPIPVKFGDLPKPIYFGNEKHFIRSSDVPRHVSPGSVQIIGMEESGRPLAPAPALPLDNVSTNTELDHSPLEKPSKTPSPEGESQGLDMLASLMPTAMAPATGSQYFSIESLFSKPDKIPGLETPSEEQAAAGPPVSRDINVHDLFAQLVANGIVKAPELKTQKADEEEEVHRVDLLKPETLRMKQPGLVARLYGGMQCSGCDVRFAPEHTARYTQHLDWHYRQNRRKRDSARRAHSRPWHYDTADWMRYVELEDLDERENSLFESGTAEGEGKPHKVVEVPSVASGAPGDRQCALCGDTFDEFFNDELDEWHLRNSVRHDDQNYHPMCYEDYKTSLANERRKCPLKNSKDEVAAVQKEVDQSDNASVLGVVEPEGNEPVEIDESDDDDVVLIEKPIEQVVVDDDADTDDETSAARAGRDRAAEIDFAKVKVKQEPLDLDDEPIIIVDEEANVGADTSRITVQSSIDGNVQLEATPAQSAIIPRGIRINITKSLPTLMRSPPQDDGHQIEGSSTDEPLPPGEEPELEYKVKPNLKDVHFNRQPPVRKGNELSGLCSIM